MTTDNIGNIVTAYMSGIVNIKTVKAVTDTTKSAFKQTKKSYSTKSSKKRVDIW
jgi:hypothetical protein